MKILIACEFTGKVRDEFAARGHDARSCDLVESERPNGRHYRRDVREVLFEEKWDLMIAFPPCTHLCSSGARWWPQKQKEQAEALEFVRTLLDAPVEKIALENPVGLIGTRIRKPDQIIHPWMFGYQEKKRTCLWLKNLPRLKPTKVVPKGPSRIYRMTDNYRRQAARCRTYRGVAKAMAEQWG